MCWAAPVSGTGPRPCCRKPKDNAADQAADLGVELAGRLARCAWWPRAGCSGSDPLLQEGPRAWSFPLGPWPSSVQFHDVARRPRSLVWGP